MLSIDQIKTGKNCNINPTVQFYGEPEDFEIGDHVRIDAFCILTGKIKLGSFIHISPGTFLFGAGGIVMEDYTCASSRVALYSVTDDFVEGYLTNPTVPEDTRKVTSGPIIFKKHSLVGTGTTVLPGVVLGYGCSVGAMSLVKQSVPDYAIMAGIPLRHFGYRNRDKLAEMEQRHLNHIL